MVFIGLIGLAAADAPLNRISSRIHRFIHCPRIFMALLGNSRPRQCTASLLFPLLGGAQRARHVSWRIGLCKPVRYEFLSPLLLQDDLVEISSWSSPLARCNF